MDQTDKRIDTSTTNRRKTSKIMNWLNALDCLPPPLFKAIKTARRHRLFGLMYLVDPTKGESAFDRVCTHLAKSQDPQTANQFVESISEVLKWSSVI